MDEIEEIKKLKRDIKISQLGQVGEKIIRNMFSSKDNTYVEDAIDLYDSTKDMIVYEKVRKVVEADEDGDADSQTILVNGKTIEVKTQTPYIELRCVSIRTGQLKKCRMVDELYFVTVPHKSYAYKGSGWILKVDPKTFTPFQYEPKKDKYTSSGKRYMYGIRLNDPAVTRVRPLTKKEIEELMSFSTSGE
jgi:hypothetical protein